MTSRKRWAVFLLLAGLVVSVGAPVYVSYRVPYLAGYLMHPLVLASQALPFLLCAALWLPWRTRAAEAPALVISAFALLASGAFHLPNLVLPGRLGGDMVGLAFVAVSGGLTLAVLAASALAGLLLWARSRRSLPG